jgi:hypothetical protein
MAGIASPVPKAPIVNATRSAFWARLTTLSGVAGAAVDRRANMPRIALAATLPGIIGMQPASRIRTSRVSAPLAPHQAGRGARR